MVFISARSRAHILAASLAGLLSACGGGGGGGGGDSGPSYSISSTSATFSATAGGAAPAPQTVTVSVSGGSVFVLTPLPTTGTGYTASFSITGPTTGAITITPDAPVSPGTLGGQIT